MRSKVVDLVRAMTWMLPSSAAKNGLLRRLGHPIHPTATAEPCLVWRVDRIRMDAGTRIGRFNVVKDLREVVIADQAVVGRFNVISAHPVYKRLFSDGASLILKPHSILTSRHHLDCAGSIEVGSFAAVAGYHTTILTHSIDLRRDSQSARPVIIGERSFISTHCVILGGAEVGPRVVVGAGSVVTRSGARRSGLWTGAPAQWRAETGGAWFDRSDTNTRRIYLPATDTTVEDAF